jgi:glycosyltransferase involved in cell wall biosynthesis
MMPRVVCVIPAFTAERTLAAVIAGTRRALPLSRILVIDDGSPDATKEVANAHADDVIALGTNQGKGTALRAGFAQALAFGATVVVTLDADGQHDPAYAPALVAGLADCDLVIGQRVQRSSAMPLRRRLTNTMANVAIGLVAGLRLQDTQSGFRAIHRRVIERVEAQGDRYEFETDFLVRAVLAGFRVRNVVIPTVYGAQSHFRGMRDSARIVRTIWAHRAASRTRERMR